MLSRLSSWLWAQQAEALQQEEEGNETSREEEAPALQVEMLEWHLPVEQPVGRPGLEEESGEGTALGQREGRGQLVKVLQI